jgi:hypothetical protein
VIWRTCSLQVMPIDQSKMGQVVTAQMEALEADYGEDCQIGDVCTIVEVVGPHGSHVRVRTSDMRPHMALGLIRMAEHAMLGNLGGSE